MRVGREYADPVVFDCDTCSAGFDALNDEMRRYLFDYIDAGDPARYAPWLERMLHTFGEGGE